MTKRAVAIGLALTAFIAGFTYIHDSVIMKGKAFFIGNFMPHSVFGIIILALMIANPLLRYLGKKAPLRAGEFAVIAAIALAGAAVPGAGFLSFFTNSMMLPHQYVKQKVPWRAESVVQMVPGYMLAGTPPQFRPDPAAPTQLGEHSFSMPAKFCAALSDPKDTSQPAAAKYLWGKLDPKHQEAIRKAAYVPEKPDPKIGAIPENITDPEEKVKAQKKAAKAKAKERKRIAKLLAAADRKAVIVLVAAFNSLLDDPTLFDSAAFAGLRIPQEALDILKFHGAQDPAAVMADNGAQVHRLLSAKDVSPEHLQIFNRHMVDIACPDAIRNRKGQRISGDFPAPAMFCASLSNANGESLSTAGKHIWARIPAEHKQAIQKASAAQGVVAAEALSEAFNSVLDETTLYDSAAFAGVPIAEEARLVLKHIGGEKPNELLKSNDSKVHELLSEKDVDPEHLQIFNRHLIDAAWPKAIRSRVGRRSDEVGSYTVGLNQNGKPVALSRIPWSAWRRPLVFWIPVFLVVSLGVLGLSLLVHKQWSQHELLPYPVMQFTSALLPEEGQTVSPLFRNRGFWWAFGLVLAIYMLNFAASIWPSVLISVPLVFKQFAVLKTVIPIFDNGGSVWVLFHVRMVPVYIGMAYLLRSDVSLSVGLAAPLIHIATAVMGVYGISMAGRESGGRLYQASPQQLFVTGAAVAFLLQIIYTGRRYYFAAFKRALFLKSEEEVAKESVWGTRLFIVCAVIFIGCLMVIGVDLHLAVLYTVLMFGLYITVSRVLAETGVFYYLASWYPCAALVGLLGIGAIAPSMAIILFMMSNVMLVRPRSVLMPFLVNSMKLVDTNKVNPGKASYWCFAGVLLAILVAVPVTLAIRHGRGFKDDFGWSKAVPHYPFAKAVHMRQKLKSRGTLKEVEAAGTVGRLAFISPDPKVILFFFIGAGLVVALSVARMRSQKWPLHPVMILILFTQSAVLLWHSFLVGWLIRVIVVKFGGQRAYKAVLPVMFGMIGGGLMGALLPGIIGAVYFLITGESLPVPKFLD